MPTFSLSSFIFREAIIDISVLNRRLNYEPSYIESWVAINGASLQELKWRYMVKRKIKRYRSMCSMLPFMWICFGNFWKDT